MLLQPESGYRISDDDTLNNTDYFTAFLFNFTPMFWITVIYTKESSWFRMPAFSIEKLLSLYFLICQLFPFLFITVHWVKVSHPFRWHFWTKEWKAQLIFQQDFVVVLAAFYQLVFLFHSLLLTFAQKLKNKTTSSNSCHHICWILGEKGETSDRISLQTNYNWKHSLQVILTRL